MTPMFTNAVSTWEELIAYEYLWNEQAGSLKRLSELFKAFQVLPSELLEQSATELFWKKSSFDNEISVIKEYIRTQGNFSVCINGTFQYPTKLRDAKYPLELFYYQGDLDLTESRCISIVGSRSASEDGKHRAAKLASGLAKEGFTIVSGLARGIDTAAMESAIEAGGNTVGVIGTPITQTYPKENQALQKFIAKKHLLISQVPFYRYSYEPFLSKRRYFPQRNSTMSALSEATIIVEASERSGTLTQARACIQQGRKLFILNSCFENRDITWPEYYSNRGAIRVRDFSDIYDSLSPLEKD